MNQHFLMDIDDLVFKSIAFECISRIKGVKTVGARWLDGLLGRDEGKGLSGMQIDREGGGVVLKIKVEIEYGIAIPKKVEEVQKKVAQEVAEMTGSIVSGVRVVVKNVFAEMPKKLSIAPCK